MMNEMCIFFCSFIDGHSFHLKKKKMFLKKPSQTLHFSQTDSREGRGSRQLTSGIWEHITDFPLRHKGLAETDHIGKNRLP